jgi:hypothetical protein
MTMIDTPTERAESAISGVGKVSAVTTAQSAPVMASRSMSVSRAAMEFGVSGGKSVMVGHDPAGGRTCRLSWGWRAHVSCVRSCRVDIRQQLELPAPQCWEKRNRGLLPTRAGGGLELLVYQLGVRLLCAGEQQGPLEVQRRAKDRQYGGTSGCEQRLGSSIARSGRPATGVLRGCVR